jgi:exodeoxyribonuclease V alpha subunit
VGDGDAAEARPLRLVDTQLYLDRYWREEGQVAGDLRALAESGPRAVGDDRLREGLARLFPGAEPADRQRIAAASAVLRRFAVVAGGPGTGKTTTVARIVALLTEQAEGDRKPLVALAAPTGKAAARLEEAVHDEARGLSVEEDVREHLLALEASTLHRLLGRRPDSNSRFRYHRGNRLPHDVVIVDETSMVGLSMMARLAEAIRPTPGSSSSVTRGSSRRSRRGRAGRVVGPAVDGLRMRPRPGPASPRCSVTRSTPPRSTSAIGDGIVVLDKVHRYGGGHRRARRRDPPGRRRRGDQGVGSRSRRRPLAPVRPGRGHRRPARAHPRRRRHRRPRDARGREAGDAGAALEALGTFRVLCAHRHGPYGVTGWTPRIESWLTQDIPGFTTTDRWYLGRPLLVTENDYGTRLYNGDTGVIVRGRRRPPDRGVRAPRAGRPRCPDPPGPGRDRVRDDVHKAQGSQFDTVAALVPTDSRLLTRQLLYTAVTRAQSRLFLVGNSASATDALSHQVARLSALSEELWTVPRAREGRR